MNTRESKHVFISYVKGNKEDIDKLCTDLKSHGIRVWRDKDDIPPGTRWEQVIRKAIREGAFFIACFSKEYHEREKTYMNKELKIAIEELSQYPIGQIWFIPVKLNKCMIPDHDIGGGETLGVFQYTELYRDWDEGIQRIVKVIQSDPPSGEDVTSSGELDGQPSNGPKQAESAADVYSVAIDFANDENFLKWGQLFKQVKANVLKPLVEWGNDELLSGQRQHDEELVNKAVEIASPLISTALAGVESQNDKFKDQKSVLNDFLNASNSELRYHLTWERIRYTLGYVYHSLHGAISLNTKQLDTALELAKVKVELYNEGNFQKLWTAAPFMGWSRLINGGSCSSGWKYVASARNRCEWLGSIFPDETEYRVALVAYYMALNIHELASVIALGQQETLSTNSLREFYVPITFISEGREINRSAVSLLHSNPDALNKLWSSLDVTQSQVEDLWHTWINKCKIWLGEVYGYGGYREVHHQHFFENF